MKILIVLGGFYPAQTYGGPTVSIDNLCTLLKEDVDFYILTSDHELHKTDRLDGIEDGWNDRGSCKVMYMRTSEDNPEYYQKVVDSLEPDLVYINSLFSAKKTVPFLRIARKRNIPLLLAPRGELCINAFDKKYKKIPYILALRRYLRADNVWYQSTSDEETSQIIKILNVNNKRIFSLTNVPAIGHDNTNITEKEMGYCRLVFISRIQAKKNLTFALRILKQVKCNVIFDIYGPKESVSYWDECEKIISEMPENVIVTYRGALSHTEVSKKFSKYHGFLFPTLSENYGHVLVEAMLEGCPVITSDQVPWTDVNDGQAGWSLSLKNESAYIEAIETIAAMDQKEFDKLSERCKKYIADKIDIETLRQNYLSSFGKMVAKTNE